MVPRHLPGRGKVAALETRPETVLADVGEVMRLAGYRDVLPADRDTILTVAMSCQTWRPACSTTPWQLEGVVRELAGAGYGNLIAALDGRVVVDARVGERTNKHRYVTDKYGVAKVRLDEPQVARIPYTPRQPFLVLDRLFPAGVTIPKVFVARTMIHLPTVRTHAFASIARAMMSALGGLPNDRRHRARAVVHETLVDLLQIQRDIHAGLFAVMDGTFAGSDFGPRAMRPPEKDILLASSDQVAIDAVSAARQGLDPMEIPFIRIAHEKGLGVGDPREIEIVGLDISLNDWMATTDETVASTGRRPIHRGSPTRNGQTVLQTPQAGWNLFASNLSSDVIRNPMAERRRVQRALETGWGRLFQSYGDGRVELPGPDPMSTAMVAAGAVGLAAAALRGAKALGRK